MDEFEYHTRRSLEELRIGLSSTCSAAARAHLGLSSLHLSRARLVEGGVVTQPRPGRRGDASRPAGSFSGIAS